MIQIMIFELAFYNVYRLQTRLQSENSWSVFSKFQGFIPNRGFVFIFPTNDYVFHSQILVLSVVLSVVLSSAITV